MIGKELLDRVVEDAARLRRADDEDTAITALMEQFEQLPWLTQLKFALHAYRDMGQRKQRWLKRALQQVDRNEARMRRQLKARTTN